MSRQHLRWQPAWRRAVKSYRPSASRSRYSSREVTTSVPSTAFGARSTAAMAELQSELGLPQTGLPDAATIEALSTKAGTTEAGGRQIQLEEWLDVKPGAEPEVQPESEPAAKPGPVKESELLPPASSEESSHEPTPVQAEQHIESNGSESFASPEWSGEQARVAPVLLGLGIVTAFAALCIYVFFSAIERRRARRNARPHRVEDDSFLTIATLPGSEPRPNHVPEVQPPSNSVWEPVTVSPEANLASKNPWCRHAHHCRSYPPRADLRAPRSILPWVPGHEAVAVGTHRLRGFIYVGDSLRPQNGWGQHDNCLVVPSLPVAARADVSGQYLDYWPSYARLSPSSRKAYLDWLASDRSSPETPIGYVFLYFYGLERRLMLEPDPLDREATIAEVERLVGVYGNNSSFRRYSAELLSAVRAVEGGHVDDKWRPIGLGDVPISDRLELGRRAAAGQTIPPALLLSLVANHPETRLRAPVRRLPELIAQRFCSQVDRDYPDGLMIALPRQVPMLEVIYRAASSTFEVPVIWADQAIPDLAQLTEPLGYGRSVLEAVTDELDSYSRELGKANGSPATIAALSKLPPELRHERAMAVASDAIAKLNVVAEGHHLYRLGELLTLVGLKTDVSTKIGLRELSQCLAEWGIGIVPDPHFAPKILAERDGVLLFRFDMTKPVETEPSDQYRLTYVSLALGVVVASSDGSVSDAERRALFRLILEAPDLSDQERRRLVADFRWLEANPLAVADLRQFLKESTPEFRKALMNALLPIAAADGNVDAGEVAVLEKLAKSLQLDPAMIYQALHRTDADDLAMVEAPHQGAGHAIPDARKSSGNGVDAARLASIRAETANASSLHDIFTDEEEQTSPVEVATPPTSDADELDQRHRVLLDELMTRPEWSEEDFERLVRQAGLMPHGVRNKINEWGIERFDELILEGDGTIVVNSLLVLETA